MKRTRIAGEKQNVGIGLNSFIMCLAGAFGCFLQNCSSSSPQDCYYLNILKAEQFNGGRICMHCKIFCVVVNTGLILGSVWLKGYTWLNVSISQRTYTKKSSVGREEMTDLFFFSWSHLKFRNKLEKDYLNLPGQKANPKLYLSFSIWKVFEVFLWKISSCAVTVRSVDDSSWHLSMDWSITFLCCKHMQYSESVHIPNRCFLQPF